jgi:hypothetical protein
MPRDGESEIKNYGAMKKIIQKCMRLFFPVALVVLIFALGSLVLNKREYIVAIEENNQKAEQEIEKLTRTKPEPTEESLRKLSQKIKDYDIDYLLYTSANQHFNLDFFRGQKPKNEVDFYFSLMSYVQFLTNYAKEAAVNIPNNFAFGFEPYAQKDLIPDRTKITFLYKQSKIIAKLLILLFDSNDYGMELHTLSRESVDSGGSKEGKKSGDTTGTIDHSKVASFVRKNGLKSYLFSIEFSCYTGAFRKFFNKLQEYSLPIVVRSLDVHSSNPSATSTITLTEKIKVSTTLEWLFIEDGKNILKSGNINQE